MPTGTEQEFPFILSSRFQMTTYQNTLATVGAATYHCASWRLTGLPIAPVVYGPLATGHQQGEQASEHFLGHPFRHLALKSGTLISLLHLPSCNDGSSHSQHPFLWITSYPCIYQSVYTLVSSSRLNMAGPKVDSWNEERKGGQRRLSDYLSSSRPGLLKCEIWVWWKHWYFILILHTYLN